MAAQELRIVVPRFGPSIVGGSEGLARRLATALAARGWGVEVWSTNAEDEATWSGGLPSDEPGDGYGVRRFPVVRPRAPRAFHQASRAFFRLPGRMRPEALWLRAQGPYAPALVAALAAAGGTPTLFTPYLYYPTVYGLPAAPHPRLLIPAAHDERPLRLAAVGRTLAAADALWYGTPEERELVESVHPVARGKPSAVGTVGIDVRAGDAARFRSRFPVPDRFFFYGGRAAAGKGVDLLLDAYRAVRSLRWDVHLVMAGSDLPRDLPAGVVTTGTLDEQSWRDALAASYAVVIPSSMESLSLLALDAWAAGRPCVVNAISPVLRGQVERSGGGVAFDGCDGLAASIEMLLDRPDEAERLGAAGREYVHANHRWDEVAARLARLIDAGAG